MALGAAIVWGATTLLIKAYPRRVGPHKTLFHRLVVSAVLLTAASLVSGEASNVTAFAFWTPIFGMLAG
jgi:drug/metabolite transporter (DMT)-like permease